MANFNQVTLIGHVGQEVKMKDINGKKLAEFSIAVNETFGKDAKKTIATWFNVDAWEGLAGIASKLLKPGLNILVQGKLKADNYEKDNLKVKSFRVVADTLQIFDPKKDEGEQA